MVEFGIEIKILSKVSIFVVNNPTSFTIPDEPAISTQSPVSNGRRISNITPAATFDKVPCRARPIARPAAPSTAIIEVVWIPNCPSDTTTVIVMPAYLATLPLIGISIGLRRGMRPSISFIVRSAFEDNQNPIIKVPIPAKNPEK